ncbi:Serine threonine family 2C [Micractinium conductrix]|uniref:Protein phosphatase n=1 Tax=Micractinium conductrix TaxID=554055 RepID=A0A2P6V5J4_9CHLO|nr:Serine threonine family 2C [Micractinium conductrix]|eukprot:PSC69359.1 Serine threonine family 2C [Micractinium conductrix]
MSSPPLDLVTSLQEATARLNAMLFNYVGALQRDAPPQLLKQGDVLVGGAAAGHSYDVQAQTEVMSKDLLAGLQELEGLIQQLPAPAGSTEGEEVAAAVMLLQQNAAAAVDLQAALSAASTKLVQLQDAHGLLAEVALAKPTAVATGLAAAACHSRVSARNFSSKAGAPSPRAVHVMSAWRSLLQRPAAVLLGTAAVSAGVWATQSEWRRQQHRPLQAASGAADPSPSARSTSCSATAAAGEDVGLAPYVPRLVLEAGAGMIPHPAKADRGGEDAFFICERGYAMGVADGVGGWAEVGVDPGLYSRELMRHANAATGTCQPGPNCPQHLLEVAYLSTAARGSSTACILCLENEHLHASNLGDSGFMIVRGGELLFMSPQQQHEFNFPYQIGSQDSMSDTPAVAQRFSVEVKPGDIVVAATDGLFDNVYPDEAASLVAASKERGETAQVAAVSLAQFARMRAADPTHLSPFAYGAQQLGYRYFGGKMDDITVLCAYVVPADSSGSIPGGGARASGALPPAAKL